MEPLLININRPKPSAFDLENTIYNMSLNEVVNSRNMRGYYNVI